MGYERDYEYGPLPTEPTELNSHGQLLVEHPCRKRRNVIARLALVAAAAWVATWAARQYTNQRLERIYKWQAVGGHVPCGSMMPPTRVASPAEAKIHQIEDDYNRGKLIECFYPGDRDVKGPIRIPLRKITLPGDAVYFFDVPVRVKHREGEEKPHRDKRARWATSGKFTLDVSADVEEVTVKPTIGIEDVLFARVCTFERDDGAKGLGVVVPEEDPEAERLNYVDFAVTIPAKSNFKSFETALWNWTHTVGDIGESALFRSLSFVGVNGPIDVKSISAHTANATTINGNITGSWAAHDKLALGTVNGRVDVDVDFKSTVPDDAAVLSLHTIGGAILADIGLATTGDFPGSFVVDAATAAAPVVINFTDAPVGSILNVTAKSISAPVNVTLHPTFEGTFEASTWGPSHQAEVHTRQGVKDPADRGRTRTVSSRTVNEPFGHAIAGEAYWGDELPERAGNAKLSTIFAPVSVVF